MSMITDHGRKAAHMSADLACLFALREASHGRHTTAAGRYREAASLYLECGCAAHAEAVLALSDRETDLATLYGG